MRDVRGKRLGMRVRAVGPVLPLGQYSAYRIRSRRHVEMANHGRPQKRANTNTRYNAAIPSTDANGECICSSKVRNELAVCSRIPSSDVTTLRCHAISVGAPKLVFLLLQQKVREVRRTVKKGSAPVFF